MGYEAQGYDTTNWWGCCPGSEGPSPPLPDKPPTDPQDRALQSIFFPDKERSEEEQEAITQEVKEEQTSVLEETAPVLKEEEGSSLKEDTTEKSPVKLKLDFASLPPPPPPPPPGEPE